MKHKNPALRLAAALLLAGALSLAPSAAHAEKNFRSNFKPFLTRGDTTWELNVGPRLNNMDWNIASDITGTATPNVLSELSWKDVLLVETQAEVRHVEPMDIGFIDGGLHLEGTASLGIPISGKNQDSDYLGDNRTDEFSRSDNDGDRGYALGSSAGVGYQIMLTGDSTHRARAIANSTSRTRSARERQVRAKALARAMHESSPIISITPILGYTWSEQNYKMTDGEQTLDLLGGGGFLGPISGLESEYTAEWWGPFLALEGEYDGKKHMFRARGEWQKLDYYGEAIWNLRTTFYQDPSFEHFSDGSGLKLSGEYAYAYEDDLALVLKGSYQKREADAGVDKTHLNTGAGTVETRLNGVNDESIALRVGIRKDW